MTRMTMDYDLNKFDAAGNALTYLGNTVIANVNDPQSDLVQTVRMLQQRAAERGFGNKLRLLPLDSVHMTVLSLLRDRDIGTPAWPDDIPMDATMSQVDAMLAERFIQVPRMQPVRMQVKWVYGSGIQLEPADAESAQALWNYRHELEQVTGVVHPNHDQYMFHFTYAYQLAPLTASEEEELQSFNQQMTPLVQQQLGIITIPQPVFAIFNDMLSYSTNLADRKPVI